MACSAVLSRAADVVHDVQLEQIAEAAAHKAVAQTFAMLGVDIHQQSDLNTLRDVLIHARKMQKISERVGLLAVMTVTAAILSGALAFIWAGLVEAVRR